MTSIEDRIRTNYGTILTKIRVGDTEEDVVLENMRPKDINRIFAAFDNKKIGDMENMSEKELEAAEAARYLDTIVDISIDILKRSFPGLEETHINSLYFDNSDILREIIANQVKRSNKDDNAIKRLRQSRRMVKSSK